RMRLERCRRVLGLPLEKTEVEDIFTRLGLAYRCEGDDFIVEPPSYRFDLVIEEDLIEEVARIYGDRKSTRLNSSHVKISYAVSGVPRALPPSPPRRSSDLGCVSSAAAGSWACHWRKPRLRISSRAWV